MLERLFTRQFMLAIIGSLVIAFGGSFGAVALGASLATVSAVVDTSFKIAAVIVGTAWALNRYFTSRVDVLQLRVDSVVELMSASDQRLFVCRLDIVNTGKSLTSPFAQVLELQSLVLRDGVVEYETFHRWPEECQHPGSPIEPGSWSAVSIAVVLPPAVDVIQVYLELEFEGGDLWTWHRHYSARNLASTAT